MASVDIAHDQRHDCDVTITALRDDVAASARRERVLRVLGTFVGDAGTSGRSCASRTSPTFSVVSRETVRTDPDYYRSCCVPNYDVSPDGKRIVRARRSAGARGLCAGDQLGRSDQGQARWRGSTMSSTAHRHQAL